MSSGRSASTVCPHVGAKADQCSETSAADCAGQVARWRCVFRAEVSRDSLATSALLYLNSNAVLLEVLHTGVTDFAPFRSVAGKCLPVSWVYAGGLHVSHDVVRNFCVRREDTTEISKFVDCRPITRSVTAWGAILGQFAFT